VEANTVRLKEHGQDVLVLEKIPANVTAPDGSVQVQYKWELKIATAFGEWLSLSINDWLQVMQIEESILWTNAALFW
jgi:hypothetical protein